MEKNDKTLKKDKKDTKRDTKKVNSKEPKKVKEKTEEKVSKVKKENNFFKTLKEKITNNKEKILKGLGIVVVVSAILGFAYWTSISYGGAGYEFTEIDVDTYLEYLKDDEKRVIYVGRPNCSHCIELVPILKKLASKYKIEIYYLNVLNFFDASLGEEGDYTEDGYKVINSTEEFKDGIGTPTLFVVEHGEIVATTSGTITNNPKETESNYKQFFKDNGYIK